MRVASYKGCVYFLHSLRGPPLLEEWSFRVNRLGFEFSRPLTSQETLGKSLLPLALVFTSEKEVQDMSHIPVPGFNSPELK